MKTYKALVWRHLLRSRPDAWARLWATPQVKAAYDKIIVDFCRLGAPCGEAAETLDESYCHLVEGDDGRFCGWSLTELEDREREIFRGHGLPSGHFMYNGLHHFVVCDYM